MSKSKVLIETLQKEQLNIIDAITLIGSTVSNMRDMNNNREAMPNSINEYLYFAESLEENPRKEFVCKRTRKMLLRYGESQFTLINLNIETFFIKEF